MKQLVSLILCILLLMAESKAQSADFILLKKRQQTLKSYFSGTTIEFETYSGAHRNGLITQIKNDSIYLQEFEVRQAMTQLGFYITDTLGSYRFVYHYQQIARIMQKKKGDFWLASGASLMGGSVLLILGSGVVYLADRKNFSPELLITATGLGLLGYYLTKVAKKGILLGKKKYRLEYIATGSLKQ